MYSTDILRSLVVLSSLSMIEASPFSTTDRGSQLQRRANPCEPGGTPVLYKEYHGDSCPPPISLDPSGFCPAEFKRKCISYCEIRQIFVYDLERPVDNSYCHGPLTCTVGTTQESGYQYHSEYDVKFLEAFGIGVTGGFNVNVATTDVRSTSVDLAENQCGYFTFLPILHHSCGSGSVGVRHDVPLDHCESYETTPNVCTVQAYRSADGRLVLGDTIFVKTNCGTRERLPMDQQDPAYRHDGVAAPQAAIDAFIGSETSPPPTPQYTSGWCTAHITQYQRNEDFGPNAGNADYQFVVCLYDAAKKLLNNWPQGGCTTVIAPAGQPQSITGLLPLTFEITAGEADEDPVVFAYGDQRWDSNHDEVHWSDFGGYEDGDREGDTGFTCA